METLDIIRALRRLYQELDEAYQDTLEDRHLRARDEVARSVVELGFALEHEHDYRFSTYCGAHVCDECGDHKGLARCYCGWSQSGRNGREELAELGEVIEEEDY